ncbi:UNVERIFIED_CONTAM: hypothetical protein Slati_2471900 [Sesamum latifolium]|uniref:DUF4283 domain-containing protein n=1 Tax=Sesamum latifolium TaxID=2727402 RepID=A0AAW2WES9_9LAMI
MDGVKVAADACGSEMVCPGSGRVNTATSPGSQIAGTGPGYEVAANTTTYLGSQIAGHVDRAVGGGMLRPGLFRDHESVAASGLFIGKIPMTSSALPSNFGATIADAFKYSSRKRYSVGYFLGKKPYFHHVKEFARSTWPVVMDVTATSYGFYFFRFKTVAAMEEHLLVEFWTIEGLSIVTSGIGRPLYQDAITKACTRLDFARVCVMLDISSKLPKHIVVMIPREGGGEAPCRVDVEYEWLPPKCTACQSLGHKTAECPDMRRHPTPAVHVFVPKNIPPHQADLRPRPLSDPRPRQQLVPRPQQDSRAPRSPQQPVPRPSRSRHQP